MILFIENPTGSNQYVVCWMRHHMDKEEEYLHKDGTWRRKARPNGYYNGKEEAEAMLSKTGSME